MIAAPEGEQETGEQETREQATGRRYQLFLQQAGRALARGKLEKANALCRSHLCRVPNAGGALFVSALAALLGDDPALADNRYAQAFRRQLQNVHATPPIPEWERIANRIAYYAELAVRREMTADAALAALDRDVDRMLEKRRWLLARGVMP